MSNCIAPGFGTGRWGIDPWGGSLASDVGGSLPVVPPFDIYCVGPCGPISTLLTHPEVMVIGDGTQFPINGFTMDQEINSGGTYLTTDAAIIISDDVPEDFTFEFTYDAASLPANFADLVDEHFYAGTFAPAGGCVGLFFSQIGISYTGAVHIDGGGDLVLDTPVQLLPGSQVLVSEDTYWTVRIAMSFSTSTVYLYVTLTSELLSSGHQLRYVMPAIPSSSAAQVPPSETLISVRGTISFPTLISLNTLCLGTGVIIPGVPPHADAGVDQAVRLCSILQLDGSASFDPQGATLTYAWRLLDAPTSSQYIINETDGLTFPLSPPTGFTDRLYSASLGVLNVLNPISPGDVFVLQGTPYNIVTTGVDGDGFFVRIADYILPDDLSTNTAFTYVLQNGLNTKTSVKPTFYPDVPGIFKFDLTVFDGSLYSEPAEVIANVVESVVARGCTPDLSFIWNYLSDFWNLVEDTQRITVFWQGLAQVAAAELLRLWQVDYNKSLRDIQRTFQRRWLHYDFLMQENPNLIAVSTVRAVYGGIESVDIPNAGITGAGGAHLDLQLSTVSFPTVIPFPPQALYTPVQAQAIIQAAMAVLDTRIVVRLIPNRAGTITRVRIDAPFPITVLATSTSPLYALGLQNGAPMGTAGSGVISTKAYKCDRSLQYLAIAPNDFLCIDGVAYRITGVLDDPSDAFFFQRVSLLDALPVPADTTWSIAGTVVSSDLDFWSGLCEVSDYVIYEVLTLASQTIVTVMGPVLGASQALPSNLPVDASPVGAYLAQPKIYAVYLSGVLRRRYVPIDPLLVDVPLLQELIINTDDTQVLRRNVDYFFDTFRGAPCLRFITPVPSDAGGPDVWQGAMPPNQMWAETSYLDNRPVIEQNFGIPAQFTLDDLAQLPSSVDYLSAVQGLWYAYWNGPTVFDLRVGTQILLGLPFAEQAGTIVSLRDDFSSTTGQILIQDTADSTIVREYTYPAALSLETNPATGKLYAIGDTVAQFAPLAQGVEISDWINDPTWFQGYLDQGAFFEVDKFFQFLVRVDSSAFNLQALLFAKSFVLRIKPTYTYPLFVVLQQIGNTGDTEVTVTTELQTSGTLYLYDGACFAGTLGVATIFDQPHAAGGGWRSQFDSSPLGPATYPTPTYPITWGFDKNYLCPEDVIIATCCTTFGSSTIPPFDSLFSFDLPVYTEESGIFAEGALDSIPASPAGLVVGLPQTIVSGGTLNTVSLEIQASGPGNPNTYNLVILKNAVAAATIPFTLTDGGFELSSGTSIVVSPGDILTCRILSTAAGAIPVLWSSVLVTVGQAVSWAYDTTLPAGTYCVYKDL